MTYTWAFDQSFLVFLGVVFVSMATAEKLRSLIPMPLIFGLIFMFLFGMGWLPKDMLLSANMIAVGTIAFNVLVIHSGTMMDFHMLKIRRKDAAVCIVGALLLIPANFLLIPIVGKGIGLLAPGSVIGGGASCAIASRWVLDKDPKISVFPWMIFMFQGLFSVPIVTWALKKEATELLEDLRTGKVLGTAVKKEVSQPDSLCSKIPKKYKSTAYYLGIVMAAAVFNRFLQTAGLGALGINPNITALLLGVLLGSLGLMDRGPLFKSDSYGLLLLGLMGLMANTVANTPIMGMLYLIPTVLLVMTVSTIVLVLTGIAAAKICHFRPSRGIALTMNCVMGFPVNNKLIEHAAAIGATDSERGFLMGQLGPLLGMGTMLISNGISIFIVSILVALI